MVSPALCCFRLWTFNHHLPQQSRCQHPRRGHRMARDVTVPGNAVAVSLIRPGRNAPCDLTYCRLLARRKPSALHSRSQEFCIMLTQHLVHVVKRQLSASRLATVEFPPSATMSAFSATVLPASARTGCHDTCGDETRKLPDQRCQCCFWRHGPGSHRLNQRVAYPSCHPLRVKPLHRGVVTGPIPIHSRNVTDLCLGARPGTRKQRQRVPLPSLLQAARWEPSPPGKRYNLTTG